MQLVGNTHLVAGGARVIPQILALLKEGGVEVIGNPDVYIREYQSFGIEEARELRERASLRPVGVRRIFVIATFSMTNEAQNALLKTLEEPPADARFFFAVSSPQTLLPTLLSRAQILILDPNVKDGDVKTFLSATVQKRLDMLKPLLEKESEDSSNGIKAGKRDMGAVIEFLSSIERELSNNPEKNADGIEAIYRARKYMGDKGALLKPLLEQAAFSIPRV